MGNRFLPFAQISVENRSPYPVLKHSLKVKALNVVANLFFPSFLCLLGALGWEYFQMDGKQELRAAPKKIGATQRDSTP